MNQLATFCVDVTPPLGSPLAAGWYGHAAGITDPLSALGLVLFTEQPIVLLALDWCEMSNRTHLLWRERLAVAAGTTPDRVTVHCTHAHCTPWPDEEAEAIVAPDHIMDIAWQSAVLDRVAAAVKAATPHPFTHIGLGRAQVEKVASNRRILGPDGKIKAVRWTKTRDPAVRAEPEGLIDPWLKTISFWNGSEKLVALHYYAVHPTSYDYDQTITSEFTGIARDRLSREDGVPHIYFTECAGNITAGKYNDGAKENRPVLTERMYRAMVESEMKIDRFAPQHFEWRTKHVHLPPREDIDGSLPAPSEPLRVRSRAALMTAYLRRSQTPIAFTSLHIDDRVCSVHLPGESFMEYQKFAQAQRPDAFVVVPSYGDCGPGYICMEKSFAEGGYEPTDSFCSPKSETIMKNAIAELLR